MKSEYGQAAHSSMNAIFKTPKRISITIPNEIHRLLLERSDLGAFLEQSGGLLVGIFDQWLQPGQWVPWRLARAWPLAAWPCQGPCT